MRRRTFDSLVSAAALVAAAVLLLAGVLALWSNSFISGQVHDQLAEQKIFFPAAGSEAIQGPRFEGLQQYAGQQLTSGDQAEAYANHFIAVHLGEIAGGKTYSEVSAASQAAPTDPKLQAQANALFKGNTLRGLLLNAYAFGKVAQIALLAGFVFLAGSVLLLILSVLGFRHARLVPDDVELGTRHPVLVEA